MEKNNYFSSGTIRENSRRMYERLKKLGLIHSELKFNPANAALLVLDMQNYFFSSDSHAFIPSAPAIVSNISKLINFFKKRNRPIVFTKHQNDQENAGMMTIWWNDLLLPDTYMANLIEQMDESVGQVFKKERYDAFWKTPLREYLVSSGVVQLVICGVMTHLCCETTARSAFVQDFKVFFVIDGTATYTKELHEASLLTLSHGFAKSILCEEILTG